MYVYVEQEEGKRSKKIFGNTGIKHMDWPRNDIQQLFELIGSVQDRRQWSSREAQWRKAGKEGQPGKGNRENQATNRPLWGLGPSLPLLNKYALPCKTS